MRKIAIVAGVTLLALAGCGDDPYQAGGTYDAGDYNGPAGQQVVRWDHEPAVTRLDTTKRCTSYRTSTTGTGKNKRASRTCASYAVSTRYVVTDDEDWYLVLLDGTRVDVSAGQQAAHPVGSVYP
jgi:hypothetical protein